MKKILSIIVVTSFLFTGVISEANAWYILAASSGCIEVPESLQEMKKKGYKIQKLSKEGLYAFPSEKGPILLTETKEQCMEMYRELNAK